MLRNLLITLLAIGAMGLQAETYRLNSTPKTVVWGYYDATTPPVLRIKSGDTVEIRTSMIASPEMLEQAGVPANEIEPALRDIYREVKDRGAGPHILTGPVYIEGAEPGDVLEVQIQSIRLALPYSLNLFQPGFGVLPEDFPYRQVRIIRLDEKTMLAHFADGIEIPIRPFFGSMGVAPPPDVGRFASFPPWIHAGNLDNKELVAGTTLYIPVHVRGALFLVGDAHAAQGNGEVDLAALETALTGTFRFVVRKDMKLHWPRAETPTHYMTMGFDEDLNQAVKNALREMLDFLVTAKHMSRDDAYMLASVAADLSITELVDGKKGVHAMIPKNIFAGTKK
ncbi:MAG TPA: acetamidase/formamidase family protein [Bryobacteraceae bacterium]|nr:acetamidase/formamidase family protein [Bryobacteraceae bacterium]